MRRFLGVLILVSSSSALATGERVALVPENSPLRSTVCFSMECDAPKPEATVHTRAVKGGLEVTVTMASGQKRLTHLVPTGADGTPSSTDLVHATTLVLHAIEVGPVESEAPKKVARPTPARPRGKVLARR
jgi:hypothetical protein